MQTRSGSNFELKTSVQYLCTLYLKAAKVLHSRILAGKEFHEWTILLKYNLQKAVVLQWGTFNFVISEVFLVVTLLPCVNVT